MSTAPRPQIMPSSSSAPNGSRDQPSGLTGTTSVWPINIKVGALILREYIDRFGNVESALRVYSGATGDDFGYPNKVLAERDRLRAAGGGKLQLPVAAAPLKIEKKAVPFTLIETTEPGEV